MADMLDGFRLGKKLGDGMSCIVKLAEKGGEKFAIKIYNKDKLDQKSIHKLINEEIAGQKDLQPHKNVVGVRGFSENGTLTKANGKKLSVAYIVMDYVDGGELMDLLIDNGGFTEDIARHFFKQMLRGLSHCHSSGITHRDLKPENMLMTRDNVLKLCDFGFAQAVQGRKGHGMASTMIGTPTYMAPEIFMAGRNGGKYDAQKADLYALGIILFIIVFGTFPLDQATEKDNYYKALLSGSWDAFWKAHNGQRKQTGQPDISDELKALITMMIVPNAAIRPTLSDVIAHPWTCGQEASLSEVEAEMHRRRADNKSRGEQPVAQERYGGTAHRDFALGDVTYYEVLDGATAENESNKVLTVQNFDQEVHDYQFQQKVNVKADVIFTQIRDVLNSAGITDKNLKMSNKSWKLKITEAERSAGTSNSAEDKDEEVKAEEDPIDLKEHVSLQFEVLRDAETNTNYLYTRRNGGSYKYFNDLWTQVKENVLLYE